MKYLAGIAVLAVALLLLVRGATDPAPATVASSSASAEIQTRSATAASVERPLEETRKVLEQVKERNRSEEF